MTLPLLPYLQLGIVSYRAALVVQHRLIQRRLDSFRVPNPATLDPTTPVGDLVLLLQHPPTYTAGRRTIGKTQDAEEQRLRALGAEYFETSRGGQTTFHGPGQLVAYPILDIRNYKLNARCYVASLERALILTCAALSIRATTTKHTGVWVGSNHKIAAIGVRLQRYISSHGVALNCDNDLAWFDHIVPCGVEGKGVTSVSEQVGRHVGVIEMVPRFNECFGEVFGRQLVEMEKVDGGRELKEQIEGVLDGLGDGR